MYRHPAKRVQAAVVSFRIGDLVTYPHSRYSTDRKMGIVMSFVSCEDSENGLPHVEIMESDTARLIEVMRDQVKKCEAA